VVVGGGDNGPLPRENGMRWNGKPLREGKGFYIQELKVKVFL
jgi:hypothetical protein